MTKDEHALEILHLLRASERAQVRLHRALARVVREHGAGLGLCEEVMAAAVLPKDPPPNPDGGRTDGD